MQKPKHILVIRLSAMGDVAMTVPVLRAFHAQYPDVRLTVLTKVFFAPFFRNMPNITVFVADVKDKHKGILGLYRLSKELKKIRIDAIADLHNVLRSKLLKIFLSGTKSVQIDKGRKEKKALVSSRLFEQLKTTHQRYADVFEQLGYPIDFSNPTFPPQAELNSKLQKILGNKNQKTVGIAPFAAHKGKMYPLDVMEKVIEMLSKKYRIILFGGGVAEIQGLNQLELISNLDVMLSMDSGNAHLAAMLGVKVITIWGVTHPYAGFAPFNQPEDNMLLSDRTQFPLIPTSVYGNKYPESYQEASRSIAPETIVKKVESII